VGAPAIFGRLIGAAGRGPLVYGYYGGAVLMVIGALAEIVLGVKAEGQSLENVTAPLTAAD